MNQKLADWLEYGLRGRSERTRNAFRESASGLCAPLEGPREQRERPSRCASHESAPADLLIESSCRLGWLEPEFVAELPLAPVISMRD